MPEIIRAFRDEKVVFVIIGDGPERGNLELRINPSTSLGAGNYELWNKVRMLGWIPNKELPMYYAIADVFIMPSDEEGFPRVLLEAMAMKVPFVASDAGGVKEIIPEVFREYLCPAGEIDCFSANIKKLLLKNKGEIEELKRMEYEQAKVFGPENPLKIFKSF